MCAWGSPLPVLPVLAGALLLASGLISQRERESGGRREDYVTS